MLVLTRKIGESINIGDDVKITLLSVKGNQVRIGVLAPKETKVHREEVYTAIKDQNLEASQANLEKSRVTSKILKKQ